MTIQSLHKLLDFLGAFALFVLILMVSMAFLRK